MRSDQITYFLKSKDIDKKLWLIWLKIVVPRAKIGFGL